MKVSVNVPYRADIDGLRAVAVLAVIGFHTTPTLVGGGFIGVDIFFVISGYLITAGILRDLANENFSIATFYAHRARRIFPALGVVVLLTWLIGYHFLYWSDFSALGKHVAAGAAFASNILLWQEVGYFDVAAEKKPLLHLWSLGIEEQFYACWPILLLLLAKRSTLLLFGLPAVIAASFALNVVFIGRDPVSTFYLPVTRFWELAAGGWLAHRQVRMTAKASSLATASGRDWMSLLGVLLICASLAALNSRTTFPGWWALLPVGGALLIIWAGPAAWLNRTMLSNRVIVYVGTISYPLYLWHWPLLSFGNLLLANEGNSRQIRLAMIGVAALLSVLTYHVVERPIRFGMFSQRPKLVAGVLCGAMVLLAALGLYTVHKRGVFAEVSPLVRSLLMFPSAHDITLLHDQALRYRSCLLDSPVQESSAYADVCIDSGYGSARERVFLMGDSHAAHLYPGVRALQGERDMKVAQFTYSHCHAGQGDDVRCAQKFRFVLDQLRVLNPTSLVIAKAWSMADLGLLDAQLVQIRQAHYKGRIILIGPVPKWKGGLPKTLVQHVVRNGAVEVPAHLLDVYLPPMREIDLLMRRKFVAVGLTYVSALDFFCNVDGCLTKLGDLPDQLTSFDDAHLTPMASRSFVRSFARLLESVE